MLRLRLAFRFGFVRRGFDPLVFGSQRRVGARYTVPHTALHPKTFTDESKQTSNWDPTPFSQNLRNLIISAKCLRALQVEYHPILFEIHLGQVLPANFLSFFCEVQPSEPGEVDYPDEFPLKKMDNFPSSVKAAFEGFDYFTQKDRIPEE